MRTGNPPGGVIGSTAAAGATVLLLTATHFAAHLDRALPSVVAPALKTHFELTDAQLGLLLGPAFGVAFFLGNLLVGRWADRAHRYRLLAWSLLLWSAACIGFASATAWEQLIGARLVLGLGQAALAPAALSLLLRGAPENGAGARWRPSPPARRWGAAPLCCSAEAC